MENLFHAAAPKLLKILEEPPDKTLFLLICENHEQVISTILSRTQIINIPAINEKDMLNAMIAYGVTSQKASQIIRLADGNYMEAMRLIEDIAADVSFELFREWMRICWRNAVPEIITWVEKFSKSGREHHKSFLRNAMRMVRESMLISNGEMIMVKLEGEELEFATKFAPFFHAQNMHNIVDAFNDSIYHIERNANPKILFIDLSLKISELLKMQAGS